MEKIKCTKCEGTGFDLNIPKVKFNHTHYQNHYPCDFCKGTGKLDWIEAVVGKKEESLLKEAWIATTQ